ncbi:phosphatidylserine/phosphatidylglycerophosphate/cardiolipin synthase family protein [Pseudomaricurvus sp. HS19]|uniref:phospholipase D-like domain-containing protein n=1 Tax=Pseudomaricurvus sp. HS19 TaxID=2692626 RepID=UPI001368C3F1|nr:phosphatidylserine/phosphatidylglycerophosphate/cardiolipin synthase family protein [Pseudomaricurvus sp. HS19]MYM62299.1 hypothetical protein [Pseudomaricurvus sp. HS19]
MSHPTAVNKSGDQELSFTRQSTEQLFDGGDSYFRQLLQELATARHSIDIEVYIFQLDTLGEKILQALVDAARRGVRVRLLMDGIGSSLHANSISQRLEDAGGDVRIYHPLPWQLSHYRRSLRRGGVLDKALYFLRKINRRDHRKLIVIDGTALWTGSLNIAAVHLSDEQGGANWHDYGVRLTGPLVAELQTDFSALWERRKFSAVKHPLRRYWHNLTRWARRRKNLQLVNRIRRARSRVWVMSAYFAPSAKVVRALKRSASRGVDVRILVPARSDIHLFPLLTATYYKDLLSAGVRVFEYLPEVLHAKLLIIDDQHILGSTNFNHRSYLHDLELDLFLHQADSKAQLQAWFARDLEYSREVTTAASHSRSLNLLPGLIARSLRYWM